MRAPLGSIRVVRRAHGWIQVRGEVQRQSVSCTIRENGDRHALESIDVLSW